jgi:hypothetical protein
VDAAGEGVSGAVTGGLKSVVRPVGYGLAALLGPVAVLSLLYGARRGFSAMKDRDKRISELKALRDKIREEEIKAQPYYKLVPRLKDVPKAEEATTAIPEEISNAA